MELDRITPLQAPYKWGITEWQIQSIANKGKCQMVIPSKVWLIPKHAHRLICRRAKAVRFDAERTN